MGGGENGGTKRERTLMELRAGESGKRNRCKQGGGCLRWEALSTHASTVETDGEGSAFIAMKDEVMFCSSGGRKWEH